MVLNILSKASEFNFNKFYKQMKDIKVWLPHKTVNQFYQSTINHILGGIKSSPSPSFLTL